MITADKRIEQSDFGNITDYSLERPEDCKRFFAFVRFTDDSYCLWDNIFTYNRQLAYLLTFQKFLDCSQYIKGLTLHEADD